MNAWERCLADEHDRAAFRESWARAPPQLDAAGTLCMADWLGVMRACQSKLRHNYVLYRRAFPGEVCGVDLATSRLLYDGAATTSFRVPVAAFSRVGGGSVQHCLATPHLKWLFDGGRLRPLSPFYLVDPSAPVVTAAEADRVLVWDTRLAAGARGDCCCRTH